MGFLMVKGSVGSSVNFLTLRTAATHRPSSRDKRMFSVFCFSIHGTHGPESNFAYYRMMAGLALYLPILFQGYSQTGFVRQPSPEPLKSLQTPLKRPPPERAPNLMASFGSARVERIKPFISILQVLWAGRDKRPSRWSASLPACWIEGPLSALFRSTPLQKHIQITSQFSQWFLWYEHDGREGASLSLSLFFIFQLIEFCPANPHLDPPTICFFPFIGTSYIRKHH